MSRMGMAKLMGRLVSILQEMTVIPDPKLLDQCVEETFQLSICRISPEDASLVSGSCEHPLLSHSTLGLDTTAEQPRKRPGKHRGLSRKIDAGSLRLQRLS